MATNINHQPNIERARDLLSPYLDGEVTAEERALVEQALAASTELRADLETMRQTVTLVAALPRVPAPRPFTLSAADVRAISPAPRKFFGLPSPRLWMGSLAAAAAVLVCVVAGGMLFFRGLPAATPAPEQAAYAPAAEKPAAAPAAEELPAAAPAKEEALATAETVYAAPAEAPAATEDAAPAAVPTEEMAQAAKVPAPEIAADTATDVGGAALEGEGERDTPTEGYLLETTTTPPPPLPAPPTPSLANEAAAPISTAAALAAPATEQAAEKPAAPTEEPMLAVIEPPASAPVTEPGLEQKGLPAATVPSTATALPSPSAPVQPTVIPSATTPTLRPEVPTPLPAAGPAPTISPWIIGLVVMAVLVVIGLIAWAVVHARGQKRP